VSGLTCTMPKGTVAPGVGVAVAARADEGVDEGEDVRRLSALRTTRSPGEEDESHDRDS